MSLMNYMKFAPRILYKKGASPLYFVLFLRFGLFDLTLKKFYSNILILITKNF